MSIYILPVLLIALLIYSSTKKVNCYSAFVNGAKGSIDTVKNIFPFLMAIMLSVALFRVSGLTDMLIKLISPLFNFIGIPSEVCELVLLRPFTGSGSISLLKDIFSAYGADSYVGRCSSVILCSSETVFYVASVYLSGTSVKKLSYALPVALFATLISSILSCLICKIL